MALHFIFGSSGAGKSSYLYNKIMKMSGEEPGTKYLVIVPEQFTMQTQKDMVMLSQGKGIMNIDVLSFIRLAYRVLEETPALNKPILEDEGKGMIIRRILREHAGEWKTFGGNINKFGFVEEVKSIVTEFLQYRVDEDEIDKMKEDSVSRKVLVSKLDDLSLVYRYYTEYMSERYISAEEILKLLADYAAESELLKGSVICIDGFTGFTPVQYMLLKELLKVCRDIYVTVTIDKDSDPFMPGEMFELFYMSKCFIKKCMDAALECGVTVMDPVWAGRKKDGMPWRFINNPQLASIERYLYRGKTANKNISSETTSNKAKQNDSFHIYEGQNPYEEASFVVWRICKLIKEYGWRYRDIAVVTGNMDLYGRLLKNEFENVHIPCFTDNNRSVLDNSFVDMILALLNVVSSGFAYDSVMHFMKNGIVCQFLGIDRNGTDMIENFILATGVRGAAVWSGEWKYKGKDFANMEEINEYREKLINLVMPFYEKMCEATTVLDYSKVLYEFLTDNNMSEAIWEKVDEYEASGKPLEKKEYEQIYRIVINLISQMAELMGDEEVSVKDYTALLTTGFQEASVGVIPPGVDSIIVGDIERTRLKDIKALFFVGVNDGTIPKAVKTGGFLSDMEREYLVGNGASLAPTVRERIFNERFYLYLNATKPSEILYVTYSRKSSDGSEIAPSPFVTELKGILGDIEEERDYTGWSLDGRLANDNGKAWWLKELRHYADIKYDIENPNADWAELHSEYMKDEANQRLFDNAFYSGETSEISALVAQKLYNNELIGSVSRLELFGACAYAHFLRYGLGLKERREYKINVPDIGILFHSIMEIFSKRLDERKVGWKNTDDELIETWTKEITEDVCADYQNGVIHSSSKNEYMVDRINRIACRSIKALAHHMKQGRFKEKAYEIMFSRITDAESLNLDLGDGNTMHLTGRIDRIDTYEDEDEVYIKVIDYKSGNKDFDINRLYFGLDMQLVVYMSAAEDIERRDNPDKVIIPAGAFYFHVDDPVVESDNEEDADRLIKKSFVMKGLLNDTGKTAFLMDEKLGSEGTGYVGGAVSDVVKYALTKSGTKNLRSTKTITNKAFQYMKQATRDKMIQYGKEIMRGNTDISPYVLSNEKPCDYCEYHSVCGFDARFTDNNYRKLQSMKESEIMDEWEKEYGDE